MNKNTNNNVYWSARQRDLSVAAQVSDVRHIRSYIQI